MSVQGEVLSRMSCLNQGAAGIFILRKILMVRSYRFRASSSELNSLSTICAGRFSSATSDTPSSSFAKNSTRSDEPRIAESICGRHRVNGAAILAP